MSAVENLFLGITQENLWKLRFLKFYVWNYVHKGDLKQVLVWSEVLNQWDYKYYKLI